MFLLIKQLHVLSVVVSFSLFATRGVWMLVESPQLQRTWVKILPHIVDTVLLASAITLAIMLQQYPFQHGWLTAKVLALLAYIIVGSIALKRGRTKIQRVVAWLMALLIFGYIVSVALTRSPLPYVG